jgi:hypothetical protein
VGVKSHEQALIDAETHGQLTGDQKLTDAVTEQRRKDQVEILRGMLDEKVFPADKALLLMEEHPHVLKDFPLSWIGRHLMHHPEQMVRYLIILRDKFNAKQTDVDECALMFSPKAGEDDSVDRYAKALLSGGFPEDCAAIKRWKTYISQGILSGSNKGM